MRMPWERLPRFISDALVGYADIYEIRLRLNERIEVCSARGRSFVGSEITPDDMENVVASLTGHSVYACEEQMREGFFTLPGGARVGVTGRYALSGEKLRYASSLSIRIPREISDGGELVWKTIYANGRLGSCLILSAPHMGKTTLLRSMIVKACESGLHVAVADERDELAGGESLGSLVDVAANCSKRLSIPRLVRAMSPEIIATDEIGHPKDASVVSDAKRCGCQVLATAHADGYQSAKRRQSLKSAVTGGIFDFYVELGHMPGHVARILDEAGGELWTDGR